MSPAPRELKYLWVLFMSGDRVECETDSCIKLVPAVVLVCVSEERADLTGQAVSLLDGVLSNLNL